MAYRKKNLSILTEDLIFILTFIEKHGYDARIVGSTVRNFLMNLKISDIDIATTATPQQLINIFTAPANKICQNITIISIGKKYGTITIIYNNKSYEITTLRKDIKTFGRKAEVTFTKSFKIDSNRRDFTINAIYMDKHGKIFDYHNGIHDIYTKNIKFIGNPAKRIAEDYLRIFRYFRFVSYYGDFKCNKHYLSAIKKLSKNALILSSERIITELLKIFALQDSYKIINSMRCILDEFFHLKYDSITICEKLKINHMTPEERMCMMLKFSKNSTHQLIQKYHFSRKMKQLLLLQYETDIKKKIKTLPKTLHAFYTKYILVKLYTEKQYNESQLQILNKDLTDFCASEYVDFKFKPSHISEFQLSKENLKNIMISTKQFWMSSNNIGLKECIAFAKDLIHKK